MKYIKLFEDHKPTSDKIREIQKKAEEETADAINSYKDMIDDVMYDIMDDYQTTSSLSNDILPSPIKTYVDYRITFRLSEWKTFLERLLEVVDRLREAYGITYYINTAVGNLRQPHPYINWKLENDNKKHPFVFNQLAEKIRLYIKNNLNNYPGDDTFTIYISF